VATEALVGPGSTADAVAGLVDLDLYACGFEFASCDQPGEAGADDDHRTGVGLEIGA
jgi:hypothetical protein